MDEREAFFAAITAHPDDDTPRLAFADWLDEPDARARFIRALPVFRQHPVREVLITLAPARAWVRSVDAGVDTVFTRNADNDPRLVRLLQRPFPGLVRAALTDHRPTRTDVFFRTKSGDGWS